MRQPGRTEKQQDALKNVRNSELRGVLNLDPGFSCQGSIGKFVGLYIQSEVFAKKLQHYYRTDTKKNGKDELQINTLNAAVRHFGLSFPESDIGVLFKGGPGKRGNKSARQLRNGYLHALSPEDKKEITTKARSFSTKLKVFLALEL